MQRTTSSPCSASSKRMVTGSGSPATSRLVVLLVPRLSSSSTRSITPVPASPTTPSPPRAEVTVSSTASSMSTARPSSRTVSLVSTVASSRRSLVSSSIAVSTSVSTIRSSRSSSLALLRVASWPRSSSVGVLPSVLALLLTLWTPSGMLVVF